MLCRLCVYEFTSGEDVNALVPNIKLLIARYLYIEVTHNEEQIAAIICENCLRRLKDYDDFYKTVEERQKVWQEIVSSAKEGIKLESTDNEITLNEPENEIKPELSDASSDSEKSYTEPIAQQFEFSVASYGNDNDEDSDEKEDVLLLSELKSKVLKAKDKIKKSAVGRAKTKRKVLKKVNKNLHAGKPKKPAKNVLSPEEEREKNDLVAKYVSFECELCEHKHKSDSYREFQAHFRLIHQRKAFITCCGKHLNKRSLILDHVQFHANPARFKCEICGKVLKSRDSLKNHVKIFHKRNELEHKCKICSKTFAYASILETHMAVHSDARSHICELCQKGFKSSVSLNFHIKHMHGERIVHICDICGKEYRFKKSFEQHVAQHTGAFIGQKKQCHICKIWVASSYFKRHIQRHEKIDVACDMCGKKFTTIPCLVSHKERHHRKVTQTYDCPYCDKSFERRRYYKEHVDLHTGHKEYTCKYCPREFRSSANMYAHQKKVHYELWAQAQLNRTQDPNNIQPSTKNKEESSVVVSSI